MKLKFLWSLKTILLACIVGETLKDYLIFLLVQVNSACLSHLRYDAKNACCIIS